MLKHHLLDRGMIFGEKGDNMYKKEFICDSCSSQFIIVHDMYDPVIQCPFCGHEIHDDEEYEEFEE
jgi:DNA-directed RNA polymerase subunit RPC12/RpoP